MQFIRYFAVCHPFYYRDAVRATTIKCRVAQYVVPVILFAMLLNLPKFFETELFYVPENVTYDVNETERVIKTKYVLTYDVTDLRKDPLYIR